MSRWPVLLDSSRYNVEIETQALHPLSSPSDLFPYTTGKLPSSITRPRTSILPHIEIFNFSITLDGIGILLAFYIDLPTAISILIYGLISKAYSHPSIRLKKRPIVSWIIVSVFQGYFVFSVTYWAIHDIPISILAKSMIQIPALLTTMMLMSAYPITQIYQHKEELHCNNY